MEKKYEGQNYNLFQLLELYEIEIPIIQRDYAQGRLDNKLIRSNFLNALHESITTEKPLMLDFIYGSIDENIFQPLDGQQRLTTLFLLYWYASVKNSTIDKNRNILSKFTYETRISSRDFCKSLVNSTVELKKETKVSEAIINSSWFYLSWKKDPTIDAMLRMIDDIHDLFFSIEKLWEKLTQTKSSLIKFYFINLENIGLSDDLYIKMNARGKLLTSFENFKATFEKVIKDNKWEEDIEVNNKFCHKIDTIWADYFWTEFRHNNIIDNSIMNLMSTLLMIQLSANRTNRQDRLSTLSKLNDNSSNLSVPLIKKDDFKYIIQIFELLLIKSKEIRDNSVFKFSFFRHNVEESFLDKIINDYKGSSYTQKVLLYAQLEFFIQCNDVDFTAYQNWMRVIRNIVARGDIEKSGKRPDIIRSPQTFDGVIYLIKELSEGCHDIFNFLRNKKDIKSTFAKEQIEEEILKANIYHSNPDIQSIIFELEDTDLLRGNISFVFHCIDYNDITSDLDINKLINVKKVITKYLASDELLTNDLRRCLLATSVENNYLFYNYWWSYWSVADCEKRRLIDNFREIEYIINSEYKDYIKNLIFNLVDTDMDTFLKDFNPDSAIFPSWKLKLIKDKEYLDSNNNIYIAIPDEADFCYLLKSPRPRDMDGCIKIE